ncbi:MAG: ATP-binding protein [Lachnospiraceae bacterium]|nr:ATP-binding protein [Lachnospiraceae bacterium]
MLLGRSSELNQLATYYGRKNSQIVVLYGQKYMGKTALLQEFMADKPGFYYTCEPVSEREQRYRFGLFFASLGIKTLKIPEYSDIFSCFAGKHSQKKVIVIDEFQNIIKTTPDFMDKLISFVHSSWNNQEFFIILCSSSVSFIENDMVSRIGEAAFELSGFIKLKELGFKELREHFYLYTNDECAVVWAILGGIPGLWNMFDDKISVKDNIIRNILDKSGPLHNVAKDLVNAELREPNVYNTILASLSCGIRKLNDLHEHTEFSRAKISVYIKTLMEFEFVTKVFSMDTDGRDNAKKGVYDISHHFLDFYFTFVFNNSSFLDTHSPEEFYSMIVSPDLKTFTGKYFKDICMEYMRALNDRNRLPIKAERFGTWVGKQGTIDIIATDSDGINIVGVCVYDKPMVTYRDYEELLDLSSKAEVKPDYVYLFSGSGFDEKINLESRIGKNLKPVLLDRI